MMVPKPFIPTIRDMPYSALQCAVDGILNLFYPDHCLVCGQAVCRRQDCSVCEICWNNCMKLRISPPFCPSCGYPRPSFDPDSSHLCGKCMVRTPIFSGARSYGHYTAELRRLIQCLKFQGRRNLVSLLVPLLAGSFFEAWSREEFDIMIPIPLHRKRRRERGFNQVELLVRRLSRTIAVPYDEHILLKVRHTPPQVGLSDTERLSNLRNAFQCRDGTGVVKKRILLVDDVMTTGATVSSAAEALLRGGALRVSVLTLARAVW